MGELEPSGGYHLLSLGRMAVWLGARPIKPSNVLRSFQPYQLAARLGRPSAFSQGSLQSGYEPRDLRQNEPVGTESWRPNQFPTFPDANPFS